MRLAVFLLVACAACGPSGPEGPHLLWSEDVKSLDNPFPDARFLEGGAAQFRAGWYEPFVAPSTLTPRFRRFFDGYSKAAATQVTGFGNFGQTLLRGSERLDRATLAGHVVRLKRSGAGWEVLEAAVAVEHVFDTLAERGLEPPADMPDFFMVRPSVPLREGDDGLLVLTKGIVTADGRPLVRGRAWDAKKPALGPVAAALGLPEADVLLALPEKAVPATALLESLAAWADAHPAAVTIPAKGYVPDESTGGQRPAGVWTAADGDWNAMLWWLELRPWNRPALDVGRVVVGQLASHELREGNLMRADWVADPSQAPVVPVHFVLTVPKGPKPAGGWKVVIGAHGAGGRNTLKVGDTNSYCMDWAQALAARGLGCIGIDAVSHGTRGVVTQFFAVDDLPAIRDRFRQMTFDLLQLERALPTIDVDGDGQGDLAAEARYFGNSMGAIMGSGFLPYAKNVSSAVLNVPGGGLSNVMVSRNIGDLIGLLIVSKTDLPFDTPAYHSAFPLFRTAGQAFFEPGDAINMVHRIPAGRAVLMQEGKDDWLVPNQTTEDLAKAMGLDSPARPIVGTAPVRAIVRVDPAKYLPPERVGDYNGHNVMWDFTPVRDQVLRFLETDGRELPSE